MMGFPSQICADDTKMETSNSKKREILQEVGGAGQTRHSADSEAVLCPMKVKPNQYSDQWRNIVAAVEDRW